MKVLIPCPGFGRIHRGIEIWVESLAKEFIKRKIETNIICGPTSHRNILPYLRVNSFPILKREQLIYKRKPFEEVSALIESASLSVSSFTFIKKIEFDVALLSQWSDLYTIPILKKFKKFKSIFCFQSSPRKLTKFLYIPLLFNSVEKIISISQFVRENVKKSLGLDSDVIFNGVDTTQFKYSKIKYKDKITLLYVGNLSKKKGIYTLIKAIEKFDHEKYTLWLIGNGPERKNLEKLVKLKKLKNIVLFGRVEHKLLPKFYRLSDIVVIPSEYPEAFAIVTAEALSSGRPVIATNIGGLTDLVKKSKGGLLFEPKNPNDLSKKIQFLTNNINERIKLAKNGRKFAVKELSWSTIAEKYIEAIKTL